MSFSPVMPRLSVGINIAAATLTPAWSSADAATYTYRPFCGLIHDSPAM